MPSLTNLPPFTEDGGEYMRNNQVALGAKADTQRVCAHNTGFRWGGRPADGIDVPKWRC